MNTFASEPACVTIGSVAMSLAAAPMVAPAQTVAGTWGGSGCSDYHSSFGFGNGAIWHTGDYWEQLVSSTGLASVSSLGLNLVFRNVLAAGNSQTFAVLLNGSGVGSFSIPNGVFAYANAWSFSPVNGVSGTDYLIRLQQTSPTVPCCKGSLRLEQGVSDYTIVGTTVTPEPSSIVLLASGLAGAAVFVRRRRRES